MVFGAIGLAQNVINALAKAIRENDLLAQQTQRSPVVKRCVFGSNPARKKGTDKFKKIMLRLQNSNSN